jgi:hypothetical protein
MEPDDLSMLAQRAAYEGPRWTRAVEDPQPPSLKKQQAGLKYAYIYRNRPVQSEKVEAQVSWP